MTRLTYGQGDFGLLDGIKRIERMASEAYAGDRRMFIFKEDLAVLEAAIRVIEKVEAGENV